ncbi:MAG: DNA polymerase, partial [Candidatus Latescibacteria bacterium]|nr:DNA polymerase [Candidatus Latescibacterota bacterium]
VIGQQIARQLVAELRDAGGEIIEVDTDGAYFVAPPHVKTEADEKRLIEEISATLPRGIHLSHDGRFKGMVSLKAKNYILVDYDGRVSLVGSSLRSRRDERIFRQFIAEIAPLLVDGDTDAASRAYLSLGRKLQDGEIDPEDFCRFERITKKTFSNPNLRRLARAAEGCRIGERIAVYQCQDGTLARAEFFTHDEDRGYLLRRVLFPDGEFRRLFPVIQPVARDQLCLF